MKKFVLLTSALALAACGGGVGGVSDDNNPRTPGNPTSRLRAVDVIGDTSDNSKITSMASAIVIAKGYNYSNIARSARTPEQRDEYTIYRLDNVDFKLAGEGDATFNFEVEDGRIVKAIGKDVEVARDTENTSVFKGEVFQLIDGSKDVDGYTIVRSSATTQQDLDDRRNAYLAQKAQDKGEALSPEEIASVTWDYMKQNWTFDTSKNYDEDLGLTYSDFGYFSTQNTEKQHNARLDENKELVADSDTGSTKAEKMLFSGGYDILPEATRPEKGAKFAGTAIGVVKTSIHDATPLYKTKYKQAFEHNWVPASGSEPGHYNDSEMAKLETKSATLRIDDNGKTHIYMPFGSDGTATDTYEGSIDPVVHWYDVKVDDGTLSFETPEDTTITKRFSLHDGEIGTPELVEGYYGISKPEEATGTVVYNENDINISGTIFDGEPIKGNAYRDFTFQAAYGMKEKQ